MLKITGLQIKDFGRHERIEQGLDGHVIGLTGPNGLGKSTVLQAIQFGLTGTIDHEDALAEFIRNTDSDKPPKKAMVVLDFEADGKKGKITRHITRNASSRELIWEGYQNGKPVTSDKQVSEILFDILGVDKRAINSTVFIKQGAIDGMFGKFAARRDFYTKLLMLEHLDKVADVVDTFRKQVADSSQDLTSVKDAAVASYEEASSHYERLNSELESMHSWDNEWACASRLVGLFDEQASAEVAVEAARAALPPAGSGVTAEEAIAESEMNLEKAQAHIKEISDRRVAWATHKAQYVSACNALETFKRQKAAVDRIAEIDTRLASYRSVLAGEDPSSIVAVMDDVITKHAKIAELPGQISELVKEIDKAKTLVDELTAARADCEVRYREASGRHAAILSDLTVRKKIRAEMGDGVTNCGCLVCGSSNPDAGFLDRSIEKLTAELETASAAKDAALNEGSAARKDLDMANSALTIHSTKHAALKTELVTLRAGLIGRPDAKSAAEARDAAAERVEEYRSARTMTEVLQSERASCLVAAGSQPADEAKIAECESNIHQLSAFNVAWDTANDTLTAELEKVVAAEKHNVNLLRSSVTALSESKARLSRVESAMAEQLRKAAEELPDTLGAMYSGSATVITADDARRIAEEVRGQQAEYNKTAGALEQAKRGMMDADARLNEIELKMAEQKHRIQLAADLAKLRDTFKPSGVSLEYLDYKFGKIAELAADYLAESQADFMVAADPNAPLSFEFMRLKPGEKWLTQSRLSGGQRVRLAVATLRAIHALIMPNVGLLVLDEPTTHLDTAAKESMADMLRRIGSEETLQMIVCDHDPILIDAFSSRIVLDE